MRERISPDEVAKYVKASGVTNPLVLVLDEGFYFYVDARTSGASAGGPISNRANDLKVSQKVSRATSPEEKWLRDYVDKSGDSHDRIAKEIGISKRCLEQRLAEKTPVQRKTLRKIREFQSKQETKAT